jgi:hypothetical protein
VKMSMVNDTNQVSTAANVPAADVPATVDTAIENLKEEENLHTPIIIETLQ